MGWFLYTLFAPAAITMFLRLASLILPGKLAQLASFLAFSITGVVLLLCSAAYGVGASIFLRFIGYGGCSQYATGRVFKWAMWWATGVWFNITGSMRREGGVSGEDALNMRPVVFVGNHQSELDVLMLGTMFPKYCSVTAKSSLKWMPFLGWFMTLSKTVFLNRQDAHASRAAFNTAASTMSTTRQSVFIFPEGTRSYASTPTLLPFKKGAFHLAIQAGVPIVPVVCQNYAHVLNFKERRFTPGTIDVTILPPISTEGCVKDDVPELVEKVRKVMTEELVRLSHVVDGGRNGMPLPAASGVDDKTRELRKRT